MYFDGASVPEMLLAYGRGNVGGFTTNPTLMAKAGVTDYRAFGQAVVAAITDLPISFEVFADEMDEMKVQAIELASWAPNVFVKIPIVNSKGVSMIPLIKDLSASGLKLNVTAVMTIDQVRSIVSAVSPGVRTICSVFAGRIADTGRDPVPVMRETVRLCAGNPDIDVLWASPREVLNIYQAEECGCHIITVTPDLIAKLALRDKNLDEFSRETAQMFYDDARKAGLSL